MRAAPVQLWAGDELMIVDDETLERDWGWVFFCVSRLWYETGEVRYATDSAPPLIVSREDGSVHRTGTAHEIDYYITRFETEFERDRSGWCLVLVEASADDPEQTQALRAELDLTAAELRDLRRRMPAVVMTGPRTQMVRTCELLRTAGVQADVTKA